MQAESYHTLHALEETHWWYVGARSVYRVLLEIGLGRPQGTQRMLEIGSGSGGNLALLECYGPTVGVELSSLALRLVPERPELGLVQARAEALPFVGDCFDGVQLLGVVEHLKRDDMALREAARVCTPDGAVILLTSALPILWSHHDEANQHHRRYTLLQLRDLLGQVGLRPLRISYQNFFVFLPTLLVRLWQRCFPQPARYDMGNPVAVLNMILIWLVKVEAWLIRFVPLPIGVDLVAVCRPNSRMPPKGA